MTLPPEKTLIERSCKISDQLSSRRRWTAIGFLVTCLPIASLGIYGLYADAVYAATLVPGPRCGMAAMGAMFLIFPIAPLLGCLAAGVGYISASVRESLTKQSGGQAPSEEPG